MPNTIIVKHRAGSTGDPSGLAAGEIAANIFDKLLYIGTGAGNVIFVDKTYVDQTVSNLVDSAPGTLDTLNELAAALGDDPNFSTTITNLINTKLDAAAVQALIDAQDPAHAIEDEGVAVTQRGVLNFVGDGVTVTDDSGNGKTVVTINTGASDVTSVNGLTGAVTLNADHINDDSTTHKFVSLAERNLINTALQPTSTIDGGTF